MAAIKYESTFISENQWTYYLTIWDNNFTGTKSELKLGAGGPVMTWSSESDDRFSPILSSTCNVPIIIENSVMQNWIKTIRTTYDEKDLYCHIYRTGSAAGASGKTPLWSGYLLIDLSQEEDVSYPYEVNLTFTDGIGLLKDRDFVPTTASPPYTTSAEVFWGPAEITYWIKQILNYTGAALTTQGSEADWSWKTCVDWYNKAHANMNDNNDPLQQTKWKMNIFNTEIADDGGYVPPNCYEVMAEIMKVWGGRLVYWKHVYWIIQIPNLNTAETGTYANPVNLQTRKYLYSANTVTASFDNLDDYWTPYELAIDTHSSGVGIKKLTGTTYNFLPPIKKATADFVSIGNNNFYGGFPTAASSSVTITHIDGASETNGFILEFPLQITQDLSSVTAGTYLDWNLMIFFDVKMDNTAYGGSIERYLETTASGTYQWGNSGDPAPAMASKPFWTASNNSSGSFIAQQAFPPIGVGASNVIDTNSDFSGNFDMIISVGAFSGGSSYALVTDVGNGTSPSSTLADAGLTWTNVINPDYSGVAPTTTGANSSINFQNATFGQAPYLGKLKFLVSATATGDYGQNYTNINNDNTSQIHEFGQLYWGDTAISTADGALQVYNGSAFVYTDIDDAGWGVHTLSGDKTFSELLLIEYMKGQASNLLVANMRLVIPSNPHYVNNIGGNYKWDGSGRNQPQMINPVGRLRENPSAEPPRHYMMQRGVFYPLMDEWDYTGIEIKDESITSTMTVTEISGGWEPTPNNLTPSFMIAPPNNVGTLGVNMNLTTTRSTVARGAVTTLEIVAIGTAVLKSGDKIMLVDKMTGQRHLLTINANQGASDTTLTIVSYTFSSNIMQGAYITFQPKDLIAQYQHKTAGTIAGMPVDADDLGPIKYADSEYTITADNIVGLDTEYIKILPSDFLANDDNTTYSVAWKDGSGQTGVIPEDGALELFAFVNIPYGKTATTVDVWGSNAKALNVYVHDVNSGGGMGTAIGTGTVNTTLDITDTASTATNFLVIKITTTATSNRIYGGKVTLTNS